MSMKPSSLHVFGQSMAWQRSVRAGVSLHCHTLHSKELLDFIPHYAARLPLVAPLFRNEMNRYEKEKGYAIDFNRCYWTPPCTARQVYEAERLQIEARLALPSLVSITDHDDITAGVQLQALSLTRAPTRPPISLEWTVPYRAGFFHLGVHNLPPDKAHEIAKELLAYTAQGAAHIELAGLLAWLNEFPEVLIVLNHPLWDLEHIGQQRHEQLLCTFLTEHLSHLHAFEINGFRSWRENQNVIGLAELHNLPVVTGGDRHGTQTNTLINLSRSERFADFVGEIREDAHSEVLLFPEYSQSRTARTCAIVADVLRTYPNHPVGAHWTERIFIDLAHESESRNVRPLSDYWQRGGPAWVRAALWMVRMLGSSTAQPALRRALSGERVVL